MRPRATLWRHHTPHSTLIPTHHLPLPTTGSQMSGAWTSSSAQCRAHSDLSPRAHSPPARGRYLSRTPALDSPAPTRSPRREPCSPEPLSGIVAPSRTGGPGSQAPLSMSPPPGKRPPRPCHRPQMATPSGATTASRTRPCHLLTSGGLEEHLRLMRGSSSGSDGPRVAASQDRLSALTLEEGLQQGLALSL